MESDAHIIESTKKWVTDVIVGCNFCPFAAKVVKEQTINYEVTQAVDEAACLEALKAALLRMDEDASIETLLLILPNTVSIFADYLRLVSLSERLMKRLGYEGIYQLASFHPLYQFHNTALNDAANYTNRSVYPMLHLLREKSIDQALLNFKNPDKIPQRNIQFARQHGISYMSELLQGCKTPPATDTKDINV